MFTSPIAATATMLAAGAALIAGQAAMAGAGGGCFIIYLILTCLPNLIGMTEARTNRRRIDHSVRAMPRSGDVFWQTAHSLVLVPTVAVSNALAMITLMIGHRLSWAPPARMGRVLGWSDSMGALWPHTLFGLAIAAVFTWCAGWTGLIWCLPFSAGLVLSGPYAIWSARAPATGNEPLSSVKPFSRAPSRRKPWEKGSYH